ncbi:vitamin B12-dependent ribonucleotide reductase [[Mycoplasma] mobile]|uniref:Vitamin B12-dependent ribonucleotide reductase n=1 Tax=Mycoplasma mobile (strain ATCC 43663 / 163K / NCTC 11711) TaxID=267748 RepID=Q6KIS3_MYCM1|nr:vitamin B12-dependent ribonucleotide reductase [[Mycoplasma] mobile]AAT27502.1 ribonucleotide reductase [Mycoplasma mobile 163K]
MKYDKEQVLHLNKTIEAHFPHIFKISDDMQISHQGVSRMVMLDRYSLKDESLATLAEGDFVIVKIKYDPMFPSLGLGTVLGFQNGSVRVQILPEYVHQIDPIILDKEKKLDDVVWVPKSYISKPLEIYYEQIAKRVGFAISKDESKKHIEAITKELADKNIIPAGRILYGAGSKKEVTFFNCYVMPMIQDSREGISKHRGQIMEIMSRGGGVGTNGSSLRPKDAIAISVGGKSSGAVSWLNDISQLTNLVQQGGSRRGAQMIMLGVWHPDIVEFIISKMQKPNILKFIKDKFHHPLIKEAVNFKLNFRPLSQEKQMNIDAILAHKNLMPHGVVVNAENLKKAGGEYEINDPGFLSGANISVALTSDFMDAVKNNEMYELRFPDLEKFTKEQKAFYDKEWHNIGDVKEWGKLGYPVKVYSTIKAKELWDLINLCSTYSAEPGVFFIDRANELTNAQSYGQKVVCTNPCGEQPLAPYSVCNLAAINLANFVDKHTGKIDYPKLENTVKLGIRFQDNIIDKTYYFLKENKDQALGERRVGLGVMGLHDMLIWSGLKYGSKEANKVVDKVFETIATSAYLTSIELGKEKGSFPFFTSVERFLQSGYVKKLPQIVIDAFKKTKAIRNSHLLTIAPTGSTGTMAGVSTGLEPYYAFKYFRSGRLGKFIEVDQDIVAEWKKIKNWPADKALPEIFSSAMDLKPEEHVKVQNLIQRWIDSSISKTVNAPKGYSVEDVEKVFMSLYDGGSKGGTVYVDGSRDAQVLSLSNELNDLNEGDDPTRPLIIAEHTRKEIEQLEKKVSSEPINKEIVKKYGTEIGNTCPICKNGIVQEIGGCNTCSVCGTQMLCGL